MSLPTRISRLDELAQDLWWSWTPDARNVFRQLDYRLWRATSHNPVRMLHAIAPAALAAAAATPRWLRLYDRALEGLERVRTRDDTWFARECPTAAAETIAYFSAEFALHQSLPIYAGGLGVLAGDHCKEASDLGVPLVGVGFMYPQGYFHQNVSSDGWQEEVYERLTWGDAPIARALTPDGRPCTAMVPLGTRTITLAAWQVRLGRVRLILLDTDLPDNAPWDRELSARLYGGDRETRVQQEVLLGVGGVRVLTALGITPTVFHLNEGHAAFVVLQRIHDLCAQGCAFDSVLAEVRRTTVFTTHTPVAAGHDAFPFQLVETHLAGAWGNLGTHRERFLALGHHDTGSGPMFNMTALALRTSGSVNGVSQLHGEVTKQMWQGVWPETPIAEVPVRYVTNGVHIPTWISAEIDALFRTYIGEDWLTRHDDPALADRIADIPDAELWAARESLRRFLLNFITERARERWARGAAASHIVAAGTMLDRQALTIGFARRFTSYKRPELIFTDPERLARIVNAPGRPVQIVFAGKAHPADESGKHHLQQIYRRALDPRFGGRVAFLEGYDLHVAHFLVQGCDVWLNTPRKPLEASGTSGMKAAINGTPNLSIGDGWWAEGYTGSNGWLINGQGADPNDHGAQDWADAQALYDLIEQQVVPAFYERDASGMPRRWLEIVRQSMLTVLPRFSARRMVKEYVHGMYMPALTGVRGHR